MNLGGTIRLNPLGFCIIIGALILLLFYTFPDSVKIDDVPSTVNLKSLLIAAIEVAEKGGNAVKSARLEADLQVKSKGKTKEGVIDPVTSADFKSHCIMYHTLVNKFPKLKVISEEHPESSCPDADNLGVDTIGVAGAPLPDVFVPRDDVTVWIDPLDATKEFTENLLHYVTTMVCVAVKGVPVIGVIHTPFGTAKTAWAWVGKGGSPEAQQAVLKDGKTEEVVVAVSRSHAGHVKNKWDVCAGNALLLAAGGSMTDLHGHKLDYSADTNPLNEQGILATLQDPKPFLEHLEGIELA
ncbi:hypothetical protein B566_EDAN016326 [Ephemera danica]|nr:hypothetical protein B566_EDAN016326 [Ephemera danica]